MHTAFEASVSSTLSELVLMMCAVEVPSAAALRLRAKVMDREWGRGTDAATCFAPSASLRRMLCRWVGFVALVVVLGSWEECVAVCEVVQLGGWQVKYNYRGKALLAEVAASLFTVW